MVDKSYTQEVIISPNGTITSTGWYESGYKLQQKQVMRVNSSPVLSEWDKKRPSVGINQDSSDYFIHLPWYGKWDHRFLLQIFTFQPPDP